MPINKQKWAIQAAWDRSEPTVFIMSFLSARDRDIYIYLDPSPYVAFFSSDGRPPRSLARSLASWALSLARSSRWIEHIHHAACIWIAHHPKGIHPVHSDRRGESASASPVDFLINLLSAVTSYPFIHDMCIHSVDRLRSIHPWAWATGESMLPYACLPAS